MNAEIDTTKKQEINCILCQNDAATLFCKKDGFDYVKCKNCHHVYVKFQVLEQEVLNHYTNRKSHHNSSIKEDWDFSETKKRYFYYPTLRKIASFTKKGRILDIGCSTGAFLNAANDLDWETYGLELETNSINVALKHNINVFNSTLDNKYFPDNYFSSITMWGVLEHLASPQKVLTEAFRILKPEGILALSTPNIRSIGWFLLHTDWNCIAPVAHPHLFTVKGVQQLTAMCGFKTKHIETLEVQPSTVKRFIRKLSGEKTIEESGAVAKMAQRFSADTMKLLLITRRLTNIPLKLFNAGEDIYGYFTKPSS